MQQNIPKTFDPRSEFACVSCHPNVCLFALCSRQINTDSSNGTNKRQTINYNYIFIPKLTHNFCTLFPFCCCHFGAGILFRKQFHTVVTFSRLALGAKSNWVYTFVRQFNSFQSPWNAIFRIKRDEIAQLSPLTLFYKLIWIMVYEQPLITCQHVLTTINFATNFAIKRNFLNCEQPFWYVSTVCCCDSLL